MSFGKQNILPQIRLGKRSRRERRQTEQLNETLVSPPVDEPRIPLAEVFTQTHNPQESSPLFTMIPPELRNRIFFIALLEDNITERAVSFDSFGYRPEHTHRHQHAVQLLRTCKLAYLEARLIPASTATHVIWHCDQARAPHGYGLSPAFYKMTEEQLAAVSSLQIYAQQWKLEKSNWTSCFNNPGTIRIRHLTVTIRHTDWWWWERDNQLNLNGNIEYGDSWRKQLSRAFPALETFRMEMETLDRRRAEMDAVVRQTRQWRIELGGGRVLSTEGEEVKLRTWQGTSQYCGGVAAPDGATSLPYYVAMVTWRVQVE